MRVKYGKLKTVFTGKIFTVKQRPVETSGVQRTFEYCLRPNSVTILPFDAQGRLLLINEYRHGSRRNVWFLPAGRIDKGENSVKAARRELREEAGFDAETIKLLYVKSPSNTLLWKINVFAAKDLRAAPLKGDEDAPIKVVPTSLSKAVKMALSGEIENEFIAYNIIRFDYMIKHGQWRW